MERKVNFYKSIKNDYCLGISIIFPLCIVVIYLIDFFISKKTNLNLIINSTLVENIKNIDFLLLVFYSIVIIICLICFFRRIVYIKSFENEYYVVKANVEHFNSYNGSYGIDLIFELEGKICKKHFALTRTKQTKKFNTDSEISLLIKDFNPKKSLILDLYFD